MARTHAIHVYAVAVKEKGRGGTRQLGSSKGCIPLLGLFRAAVDARVGKQFFVRPANEDSNVAPHYWELTRKAKEYAKFGYVCGAIEFGQPGIGAPIKSIETGKTTHKKTTRECEMPPYYFGLQAIEGAERGFLFVHKIGIQSPKAALQKLLEETIEAHDPRLKIGLRPYVNAKALREYVGNGMVRSVIGRRHVPAEATSWLEMLHLAGKPLEVGTDVEVVIKHKSGLDAVRDMIMGYLKKSERLPKSGMLEIDGSKDFDDLIIEAEKGKRRRKFFISRRVGESIGYNITDEVQAGIEVATGLPRFETVDRVVINTCLADIEH